jgi:probable HAF family extracellular repeat protein
MTDLGTLGGTHSIAKSINDRGQIVGSSLTTPGSDQEHAFLYFNGKMTDLGTLPGMTYSYAYGINNNGQTVGYSRSLYQEHAFLYTPQPISLPGILPLLLGD